MRCILFITLIAGCASAQKNPALDSKKLNIEKRVVTREPGSLWTDESHWNTVFTDQMPRKPGDVFKVRFTDGFREWMSKRLKKDFSKGRSETAMAETDMVVKVSEVNAGGTFQVTGSRDVKFVDEPVEVSIHATVREKDLQNDDSISWDHLFNLNVGVEAKKS